MKIIFLVFGILAPSLYQSVNPGLITEIHLGTLNKFLDQLLPIINDHIKEITIDEKLVIDEITIKRSYVKAEPFEPKEIYIEQAETDHFHLVCNNIKFDLKNDVDVHWKFFKSSGVIRTRGKIDKVVSKITFKNYDPNDPKPYLDLKVEHMELYVNNWDVDVDIKNIPNFLINLIIKLFKANILKDFLEKVIRAINEKAKIKVNQKIKEQYPLQIDSDYNISVESILTGSPLIISNSMLIQVDGTFFDTTNGYHRFTEPDYMELDRDDMYLVDLFLSEYTVNSLFSALYNKDVEIHFGPFVISFIVQEDKKFIKFLDGQIKLEDFSFMGRVQIGPLLGSLDASVNGTFKINRVNPLDKKVHLQIVDINFTKFIINSTWDQLVKYSDIIRLALQTGLMFKENFAIAVPKLKIPYNIDVYDINIQVNEHNIKIGVDFNVEQFVKGFIGL